MIGRHDPRARASPANDRRASPGAGRRARPAEQDRPTTEVRPIAPRVARRVRPSLTAPAARRDGTTRGARRDRRGAVRRIDRLDARSTVHAGPAADRLAGPDLQATTEGLGPTPPQVGRRPTAARGVRRHGAGPPPDRGPWRPPTHGGPPPDRGPWRPPTRGGPPPDRSGPPPGRSGAPFERPYRDRPRPSGPPARPTPGPWPRPAPDAGGWPRPAAALPAPDLLGPDEELVAGRRPVEEVFAAGRTAHRLLVVPQRRNALEQLVLHATRLRIPIVEVEGGSLTAIAGFDGHQGVALVVEPRRFATLGDIIARAAERGEPPFVLVLDSLEDPQNLGTLLRSAEAAGVHGVVFPTRRQAPLSAAAVKASAGATEHLLLCPVDDLPGALADLHSRWPADRRLRGRRAVDRAPDRSARAARDRRRQRGPGSRTGHPPALRPVHAHPDARRDRVLERRGRGVRAAVRSRRPKGSREDRRPVGRPSAFTGPTPPQPSEEEATADVAEPPADDVPTPATSNPTRRAKAKPANPSEVEAVTPDDRVRPTRRRPPARRPGRPGGRETEEATSAPHPPRLTHQRRTALSFPGAGGVSCGMSLRVVPT